MRDAKPEAMTVSVGFFEAGGWLAKAAYGRRNGWTLAESFRRAMRVRPKYVQIHQYQEFAGQPEGQGYGPNRDHYVDSYSPEFSDDVEPTSLTAPAYRGEGGWGFLQLNQMRALVDLYRQPRPETSVVAIGKPLRGAAVRGSALDVEWTLVGKPARRYRVTVSGRDASGKARSVTLGLPSTATRARMDLTDLAAGPMTLRVTAEGTQCRYRPSWTEDSLPLARPVEAYAELIVNKLPTARAQREDRSAEGARTDEKQTPPSSG